VDRNSFNSVGREYLSNVGRESLNNVDREGLASTLGREFVNNADRNSFNSVGRESLNNVDRNSYSVGREALNNVDREGLANTLGRESINNVDRNSLYNSVGREAIKTVDRNSFNSVGRESLRTVDRNSYSVGREALNSVDREGLASTLGREFVNNADRNSLYNSVGRESLNGVRTKRQSGLSVCSCFDQSIQCLTASSCASKSVVLQGLCSWDSGRVFAGCDACSGLGISASNAPTTSGLIQTAFDAMYPSIAQAIPLLVPSISSISVTYDETNDVYVVDVTLAPGVVAYDTAYNQLVFQLSKIFDVYPGVISWSAVSAKRQTSNSINIKIVNEDNFTSSSTTLFVSVLGFIGVALLNVLLC